MFFNTRGWIHHMGMSLLAWCGVPGDGSVRGVGWMAPNTPLQQGLGGCRGVRQITSLAFPHSGHSGLVHHTLRDALCE